MSDFDSVRYANLKSDDIIARARHIAIGIMARYTPIEDANYELAVTRKTVKILAGRMNQASMMLEEQLLPIARKNKDTKAVEAICALIEYIRFGNI